MQPAQLCHSCGFGSRKNECLKCGSAISRGFTVEFCPACSGKNRDKCVKCGKPLTAPGVAALLCGSCAFQPAGKKCIRCERYLDRTAASA